MHQVGRQIILLSQYLHGSFSDFVNLKQL